MPADDAAAAALIRAAVARLAAAGVESARGDAEQLLAHALGVPRGSLPAIDPVDPGAADAFRALVAQRAARVPLQHLVGTVGFRHLDLAVGPGVFVPRPETEVVAGVAIDCARAAGPAPRVVDLCSGSGAIALSVAQEVSAAEVHAVELDPAALEWLRRNVAARAAAGDPAVIVHAGDARDPLPELDGRVDVVVANPPYVAAAEIDRAEPEVRDHDPWVALVAADDGLEMLRAVAAAARRLLRPGGWAVVEHGADQGETAPAALTAAGFVDVTDRRDLAGRPRVAAGRAPGQAGHP